MRPAIHVEQLSKQYRLGAGPRGGYRTLREAIVEGVRGPWSRLRRGRAPASVQAESRNTLWALRDVSFEVRPGEVVGVIGRNGSGKSTLLKILSRVTEPTAGRAELRGRVGSLLEVGTGFHPELTGRENVYLSGAILGMSREEIGRKFDAIVAFAEMERFLDTPVKRYSSGMYVRLAFAVAAHLEPEILIVDEVLAVGDANYQRKCVNRMRDLAQGGRTILFVSHNMDFVPRLCTQAVLLERGRVRATGRAGPIVDRYLAELRGPGGDGDLGGASRGGDGRARFTRVRVRGPEGGPANVHQSGDDLTVEFTVEAAGPVAGATLAVNLRTASGTKVYSAWTQEQGVPVALRPGRQAFRCTFRQVRLRPGRTVEVELWMAADGVLDHVGEALRVPVIDGPDTRALANVSDQGVVLTDVAWDTVPDDAAEPPAPAGH
jgi:lipopolysaccharide transport system ATP-binding protein